MSSEALDNRAYSEDQASKAESAPQVEGTDKQEGGFRRESRLLKILRSETGQSYLKYRFFREPYWIGYTSVLSVTFYALIAISLSFTPLAILAMPVGATLFFLQVRGIYRFVKEYVDEQEAKLAEDPDHIYEAQSYQSFIASNFTKAQETKRAKNPYFDLLVYGYHFIYFATALLAMYAAFRT